MNVRASIIQHVTIENEVLKIEARGGVGLRAAGEAVQAEARHNLNVHHFHGTAEQATTVQGPKPEPFGLIVTVGVHDLTQAPHARALEFGWKSESGKQPPSEPIQEWLDEKGIGDPADRPGMAFVIARRIGHGDPNTGRQPGFSFGALHWLGEAGIAATPALVAAVEGAIRE